MLAAATRPAVLLRTPAPARPFARFASTHQHKVVIVGGGTAGVSVAAQLERAFAAEGRALKEGDIAIVEPAQTHHCASSLESSSAKVACSTRFGASRTDSDLARATDQPGWTLVCVPAFLLAFRYPTRRADPPPGRSGAGLQPLSLMHKPMNEVIPQGVKRYETAVETFQPDQNQVTTSDDSKIKCVPCPSLPSP